MFSGHLKRLCVFSAVLLLVCVSACGLDTFKNRTTAGVRTFHQIPTEDGALLATDVYLPEGEGPWPAILVRSTYSRNQGMNGYLQKGYAVVIQDVRGMGGSTGEAHAFYYDGWRPGVMDGAATVAWIKAQPWCNGKIGTEGESALAMTQMLLAPSTQEVQAQFMELVPSNYYHEVTYTGGVLRKNLVEGWLTAMGQPHVVAFYKERPRYDEFWDYYNAVKQAPRITAPGLFVNGWYDIFAQGTINGFVSREYEGGEGARGNNYLIMRWTAHMRETTRDYKFKENRHDLRISEIRDKFFECHLRGDTDALAGVPKVHYYVMGDDVAPDAPGNEWRTADAWPPYPMKTLALYPNAEGALSLSPEEAAPGYHEFLFDPNTPYPTWGGANLLPNLVAGPYDQRKYSAIRTDLLKFATAPLTEPLEIVGNVKVRLFVSSDAPDTDFTAKLVDIFPEGDSREILMLDNIRRVKSRNGFDQEAPPLQGWDDIVEIEIDLWSIAWVFNVNHRIGLHISSSNYPRFEVNPNTGADHPVPGAPMRSANNRVHYGPLHPSALLLPVRADNVDIPE